MHSGYSSLHLDHLLSIVSKHIQDGTVEYMQIGRCIISI